MRSRAEIVKLENELRDFQWQLHAQAYCHAEQYAEAREQSRLAEYERATKVFETYRQRRDRTLYDIAAETGETVALCKECGQPFIKRRITMKFCSITCSRHDQRRKQEAKIKSMKAAQAPVKICVICGAEFKSNYTKQKFCCRDCYNKDRWAREKEARRLAKEVC